MRTFVIGDIHGCNKALLECLEAVNFDYNEDRLISIGDLTDRGLESFYVAETLIKIKNKILIQGNHDIWFKDFLLFQRIREFYQYNAWTSQGGHETINSYIVHGGMNAATGDFKRKKEHQQLYASQVPYHYENGICFVHGGLDRKYFIKDQDPVSLAWDREFFQQAMSCTGSQRLSNVDMFRMFFVGHTPTQHWRKEKPLFRGGVWNIDTGAGKGGYLTIMNLQTQEYHQVKDPF